MDDNLSLATRRHHACPVLLCSLLAMSALEGGFGQSTAMNAGSPVTSPESNPPESLDGKGLLISQDFNPEIGQARLGGKRIPPTRRKPKHMLAGCTKTQNQHQIEERWRRGRALSIRLGSDAEVRWRANRPLIDEEPEEDGVLRTTK